MKRANSIHKPSRAHRAARAWWWHHRSAQRNGEATLALARIAAAVREGAR